VNKKLAVLVLCNLVLISDCAKKTAVKEHTPVSQESYTVRFIGYKITAKVNTTPSELEKYLLDVKTLERSTKSYKLKVTGNSVLRKPGDIAEMKMDLAGISIPGKAMLVKYTPGSEIWVILFGKFGGTGVIRFNLKEVKDGTRLGMKFEFGEMENVMAAVNMGDGLKQVVMNLVESSIAKGMAHFDKSVTAEELLARGIRGETYETFYNGHRAEVWVNAGPMSVDKVLRSQSLWDDLNRKGLVDMGDCVIKARPEPCPIRLKVAGFDFDINSFHVLSKPGDQISAYWVSEQLIAHNQFLIKPERNGARVSFIYVLEMPQAMTTQGTDILMNMTNFPGYIEKILTEIKQRTEGTG
jgi:hypothetical protein